MKTRKGNKIKKEVKIREVILAYIAAFIIIMIATIGLELGTSILPTPELMVAIFKGMLILYLLARMISYKGHIKDRYIDFREKLSAKEIVGRYINVNVLNMGLMALFFGVFVFINKDFVNEILNSATSSQEMLYDGNITINAISMIILAPILEELIFRKVVFTRLSQKLNTTWAIIISSILFGIAHASDAMASALLAGVVLCILYKKYNNILIPMTLHFLNNLTSVILLLADSSGLNIEDSSEIITLAETDGIMFLTIGIVITCVALYFYIKYIKNNEQYLSNSTNVNL